MEQKDEAAILKYRYLDEMEVKETLSDSEINKLVKYAIYEVDFSANGYFLKPCLVQLGVEAISAMIYEYYKNGTIREQIGALKLWYWAVEETSFFCAKKKKIIANKQAIRNNNNEYTNRLKLLKADLQESNDMLLMFFFQWAISKEGDSNLFKGVPETILELKDYLIKKKQTESLSILNSMYPHLATE